MDHYKAASSKAQASYANICLTLITSQIYNDIETNMEEHQGMLKLIILLKEACGETST